MADRDARPAQAMFPNGVMFCGLLLDTKRGRQMKALDTISCF